MTGPTSNGAGVARLLLGGVGVGVGLYGGWLVYSRQDGDQLVAIVTWLVAGVLLHDVVVSAVVVVLGLVVSRLLPAPARAPVTVGGVVLASVTLLAIPVLGRFGAKDDNPSLLDRDYVTGWWVLVGLVVAGVVVASVTRWRRDQRGNTTRVSTGGLDN